MPCLFGYSAGHEQFLWLKCPCLNSSNFAVIAPVPVLCGLMHFRSSVPSLRWENTSRSTGRWYGHGERGTGDIQQFLPVVFLCSPSAGVSNVTLVPSAHKVHQAMQALIMKLRIQHSTPYLPLAASFGLPVSSHQFCRFTAPDRTQRKPEEPGPDDCCQVPASRAVLA